MNAIDPVVASLAEGVLVAIEIEAKDGEEEAVGQALASLAEPTMREPGAKLFRLLRSTADPKAFLVLELYHDADGRAAHEQTAHFKRFAEETLPRIASRKLTSYRPC